MREESYCPACEGRHRAHTCEKVIEREQVMKRSNPKKGVEPKSGRSTNSEEKVFQVECILNSRQRGGGTQYLVHWLGFGEEERTWEPEANVFDTSLIDDYKRRQAKSKKSVRSADDKKEPPSTSTTPRPSPGRQPKGDC